MGVFRGTGASVDVMAISAEMAPAVRQWESAYVVIIDPGANNINLRDKNNAAFKWHGMARVQPYRREVATATTTNPTTNQTVRFQIDFGVDGAIPDIKTNWQVVVLPESLSGIPVPDPYLSVYQHVVRSAMNSSLAWIRTIECQVNTEVRPNYQIESDGADGWRWVA
jgi:hypothetical protein